MRPRSKIITKIIVFALIVYAGITLITLRERIETAREEYRDARRLVLDMEISNAELQYEIDNHDDPDVIAGIARSNLGLVMPGEIVFYDSGSEPVTAD